MTDDQQNNMFVGVRIRPTVQDEDYASSDGVFHVIENSISVDTTISQKGVTREFTFSKCFGNSNDRDNSQIRLYQDIGAKIVEESLSGYNCTLFAYGQSSSGKTYSIMGDLEDESCLGLTPRICRDLIDRINNMSDNNKLSMSFLEIYDDRIYDLLVDDRFSKNYPVGNNLKLRENPKTGAFVENLRKIEVNTYDDLLHWLKIGMHQRRTSETLLNSRSSRSHAVVTLYLELADFKNPHGIHYASRHSQVSLVDLAGSERQGRSGALDSKLKEACAINSSLSVLGRVIRDLSEKGHSLAYRESVLTRFLRESLCGNSKTFMLATVNPLKENLQESISTLKYASTAQKIKNHAVVNETNSENQLLRRKIENERLLVKIQNLQDASFGQTDFDLMEQEVHSLVESYECTIADLKDNVKRESMESDLMRKELQELQRNNEEAGVRFEKEKSQLQENLRKSMQLIVCMVLRFALQQNDMAKLKSEIAARKIDISQNEIHPEFYSKVNQTKCSGGSCIIS